MLHNSLLHNESKPKGQMVYMTLGEWSADVLIFVDESAANEIFLDKNNGWAPRGILAINSQILDRSTRWSIHPAYTIYGYPDNTIIVQGSVDSESFCNWLSDHILHNVTHILDLALFLLWMTAVCTEMRFII